jgi:hypothetical protein
VGFGVGLYVLFELCIEVSGYIENCRAFESYSKHSGPGHYVLEVLPLFHFRTVVSLTSRYNRFHLYQLRWFGFSADGIQRFGLVEVSVTCLLVSFTVNYSSHCQIGSLPIPG